MSTGCRDCRAGLDHCHGTIIYHADGPLRNRTECTEPDCVAPELFTHTFVIDCDVVGCDCGASADPIRSSHRVGA